MAKLPAGPYRVIALSNGTAPWYIAPFDKDGATTGPRTRAALVDDVAQGVYTDIVVFSHGWNNTWKQATRSYERFIDGYRTAHAELPAKAPYAPLLVGIFWPSIDLVFPWERGPRFAGEVSDATDDDDIDEERRAIAELASEMDARDRSRFYELTQQATVSDGEIRELAEMLAPQYMGADEEFAEKPRTPSTPELVSAWTAFPRGTSDSGIAKWTTAARGRGRAAQVAGSAGLDPRDIVRAATVWKMKDRAGNVGALGVAPLLRDLHRASPRSALRLVGHSYGCRLLLAAVASEILEETDDAPIDSMLLLQAAVNFYCFAEQTPYTGEPGGFRPALRKVRQPILATFSRRDRALRDLFHLAVRRSHNDLGEEGPRAAALGSAPSVYCALGGYGPAGMGAVAEEMPIKSKPERYPLDDSAHRVFALRADDEIRGHSDVANPYTYWALFNQMNA